MYDYAGKSDRKESRAIANNLSKRPAGTVSLTSPLPSPAPLPVVQRVRYFADDITQNAKNVIQEVLNASPVLMAMWQWLKNHAAFELHVIKSQGFASVEAKLGEDKVYLKINPDNATGERREALLGTVSHELNLHMLPWARPNMTQEINANKDNIAAYDAGQLARVQTVLGPIMPNEATAQKELKADIDNKNTATWGGNHSDIGLWTAHLNTLIGLAANEADGGKKVKILEDAIFKMLLPMTLTGRVEDAIDRGPGALIAFETALNTIAGYTNQVPEGARRTSFTANILWVRNRARTYEAHLVNKRSAATIPADKESKKMDTSKTDI